MTIVQMFLSLTQKEEPFLTIFNHDFEGYQAICKIGSKNADAS